MVSRPNLASKRWVYEQYDSMVGTVNRSTNRPWRRRRGAVSRAPTKGLAVERGLQRPICRGRSPAKGCAIAVAEAARNIACVGGTPSAITNCLNFGNPYNPEVYWQFVGAIQGMGDACLARSIAPVTGGNVSFYNQTVDADGTAKPVYPTPTIGMLGLFGAGRAAR